MRNKQLTFFDQVKGQVRKWMLQGRKKECVSFILSRYEGGICILGEVGMVLMNGKGDLRS